MSFLDLNNISKSELIAQYIIDHRQQGLYLNNQEYKVIEKWLSLTDQDADKILLVLSQIHSSRTSPRPFLSLKKIETQVTKELEHIT